MSRIHLSRTICLVCVVVAISLVSRRVVSASEVDFVRDIRPIISENCVFCHGPDEDNRQAGLRLDTEDGLAETIDVGDAESSELIRRMLSDDPDEQMPPPDSNRTLSPEQIGLVRSWIDQGATWQQHWSFRPIVAPEIPAVDPSTLPPGVHVRGPIDALVQNRMALREQADAPENVLHPSPEADRRTLIRRLSLDLTGLPPKPDQVDAFINDASDDAYERVVDRLLDSPAYGQRMAWDWLDAARYADTNGYQGDNERTMWPWRDWVVDAFNRNLPYDQFTLWQLAGDCLPEDERTDETVLATGFLRNHMINGEGGRIPEENRVEYVMDMSETMGTVWLGMTLNCCRCHDHKYDPITHEEYYQFYAFFNQTPVTGGGGNPQTEPSLAVPSDDQLAELARLNAAIDQLNRQQQELADRLAPDQAEWQRDRLAAAKSSPTWNVIQPETVFAKASTARKLPDGSVLSSHADPANDTYTFIGRPPGTPSDGGESGTPITGVRLEALPHESLFQGSLSRAASGNFVLTGFEVAVVDSAGDSGVDSAGDATDGVPVRIANAEATFEQSGHPIGHSIDGESKKGWAVWDGKLVQRKHAAVFRFDEEILLRDDQHLKIVLRHDSKHAKHVIGRYRLSVTDDSKPRLGDESDEVLAALAMDPEHWSAEQTKLVRTAFLDSHADYQALDSQRDALVKQRSQVQASFAKVMVMDDLDQPRSTFVLERGLYNKPTDEVVAKLPEFLPRPTSHDRKIHPNAPESGESSSMDRLDLARWLMDPNHPLTARVTVNRFWQQIFGIGLVKTTEDFGTQGEYPLQGALLDYLAATFRDSGWNVKQLIREIVTSHTYRQSSKIPSQAAYEADPKNRYLSRGARYRIASWMIRDQALAASGLLSPVVGGPAVNTYQPPGVWEEASFGKKTYQQDEGEKLYRRSLYVFWRRITAPTMFFDSASRQICSVKPNLTNTPLHSLQTMNNVAYVEAARRLGELTLSDAGAADDGSDKDVSTQDVDRIDFVMRRVLGRRASEAEQRVLVAGLDRTRAQYADQTEAAIELISHGESARDESMDPVELAAWTNLCLAILNFDETLNRE